MKITRTATLESIERRSNQSNVMIVNGLDETLAPGGRKLGDLGRRFVIDVTPEEADALAPSVGKTVTFSIDTEE